jgi:hypothetical protein
MTAAKSPSQVESKGIYHLNPTPVQPWPSGRHFRYCHWNLPVGGGRRGSLKKLHYVLFSEYPSHPSQVFYLKGALKKKERIDTFYVSLFRADSIQLVTPVPESRV